uniref:Ovule protein n=1 Tax=Caenorhabditis tropicalis TaxID=1561998 RepID=A0A1I7TSQ6_9PELO
MKLQPVVPWLKKTNSEDESMLKIENSPDRVESTSGFEKAVARFSDRLDRTGAIPTLSLQNHTDTTIGTVEKALLAVALAKQNSGIPHETLPVFDLLVERSDWLLYREEFNDETDYPPINPFYSHDIVSSDFEEYEQDQEAAFDPSYSDMVKKEIREYDHEDGKDVQKCTLDFLNEPGNLDSQEDFFSGEIPSTLSPPGNFSLFEFSCPSPKNLKATKRSFDHCPLTPEGPSTSKKIHYSSNPLENVPSISTSSDYSPFNYSFLSSSNSPPNSSPGSSKYSFW